MAVPNFDNLKKFATKCTTSQSDNVVVSAHEAKSVVLDYQKLLSYTVELQNKLLEAEKERDTPTEIEIRSSNF